MVLVVVMSGSNVFAQRYLNPYVYQPGDYYDNLIVRPANNESGQDLLAESHAVYIAAKKTYETNQANWPNNPAYDLFPHTAQEALTTNSSKPGYKPDYKTARKELIAEFNRVQARFESEVNSPEFRRFPEVIQNRAASQIEVNRVSAALKVISVAMSNLYKSSRLETMLTTNNPIKEVVTKSKFDFDFLSGYNFVGDKNLNTDQLGQIKGSIPNKDINFSNANNAQRLEIMFQVINLDMKEYSRLFYDEMLRSINIKTESKQSRSQIEKAVNTNISQILSAMSNGTDLNSTQIEFLQAIYKMAQISQIADVTYKHSVHEFKNRIDTEPLLMSPESFIESFKGKMTERSTVKSELKTELKTAVSSNSSNKCRSYFGR